MEVELEVVDVFFGSQSVQPVEVEVELEVVVDVFFVAQSVQPVDELVEVEVEVVFGSQSLQPVEEELVEVEVLVEVLGSQSVSARAVALSPRRTDVVANFILIEFWRVAVN